MVARVHEENAVGQDDCGTVSRIFLMFYRDASSLHSMLPHCASLTPLVHLGRAHFNLALLL